MKKQKSTFFYNIARVPVLFPSHEYALHHVSFRISKTKVKLRIITLLLGIFIYHF
jgi:hypothetical protein